MIVSCSTSGFKMPFDEALQRISGMGFSHADLICIPGFGHLMPDDLTDNTTAEVERVRSLLDETGIQPSAMNVALGTLYDRSDDAAVSRRIEHVHGIARFMKELNVEYASFFPGSNWPAREWERGKVVEGQAKTLREVLEAADEEGVQFIMEPHANTPFETLEQIRELFECVPELKIAFDPSHFLMQGIKQADSYELLERTVHLHLRDARRGEMICPWGEGDLDVSDLVRTLNDRSFLGAIALEYLPTVETDIEADLLKAKTDLDGRMG